MSLDSPIIERHGDRYRMVFDEVYATELDDLWQAITTADRLARWMGDYRGDLRLGGTWTVHADDGSMWGTGTVTACDPPHGFATIWHAAEEEPTEMRVRLEPVDDGTKLILEHTGIQSIYYGPGWQTYLELLARHVAEPHAALVDGVAWDARYSEIQPSYDERFADLRA